MSNEVFNNQNSENNTSKNNPELIQGENFVIMADSEEKKSYVGENYTVSEEEKFRENLNAQYNGSNFSSGDQTQNLNYNMGGNGKSKKKGFFNKRVLSYILVGVICTTLGGIASGLASLYLLPNTDMFENTPLYQAIMENNSEYVQVDANHPTTLASSKESLTVAEIAKKVGPAVVGVSTKSKSGLDFFGNEGITEGIGSGIIINEQGYVLTNFHVIQGAQEVNVIFSNGKEVAAKVVNYDAEIDAAIVKVTDDVKMPAVAELGYSSSLQVGEQVVAIGNPLGKEFLGTVTTGVVSAVNRKLGNDSVNYIQTDAAINSGNSGGPLVNSRGQVIGINTAKIGQSGVEGLGFAIPIDQVKDKIDSLSKPVLRVGITCREITEDLSKQLTKQYNIEFPVGVYIEEVQEFSPAEKAGLKIGDIITKFDGQKVKNVSEINQIKTKHKSGDIVKVEISRDGKVKELELKLTE
jgi:serine protease Do